MNLKVSFFPDWKPVASLPEALALSGPCPCGEVAYASFISRSTQGRGRPKITQIQCAGCGRPLATSKSGLIRAAVYTYSPWFEASAKAESAITKAGGLTTTTPKEYRANEK